LLFEVTKVVVNDLEVGINGLVIAIIVARFRTNLLSFVS